MGAILLNNARFITTPILVMSSQAIFLFQLTVSSIIVSQVKNPLLLYFFIPFKTSALSSAAAAASKKGPTYLTYQLTSQHVQHPRFRICIQPGSDELTPQHINYPTTAKRNVGT